MEISRALDRYCRNQGSDQDLQNIYEFCRRIAMRHLRFIDSYSGFRVIRNRSDSEIEDEAASCITRLFCPERKSGKSPLVSFWASIRKRNVFTEEQILKYLVNLIKSVVLQQKSEIMRINCPQEWKVRRNLRLVVSRSENYRMFRHRGRLLFTALKNKNLTWKVVPESDLQTHCYSRFVGRDSLETMLKKAMACIDQPEGAHNAIDSEDLAKIIIQFVANMLALHDQHGSKKVSQGDELLRNFISTVMTKMRQKIEQIYLARKKISREKAGLYMRALEMLLTDLLVSGSQGSHFDYLAGVIPQLDRRLFGTDYKAQFGYLVTELKKVARRSAIVYSHASAIDQSMLMKNIRKNFNTG